MMDETGTAGCVKQFALELYGSEGVPATCLYLQTNGTNLSVGGKTMLRARGVETMYKAAMFFMLAIIVAKGAEGQEPNPDGQTLGADRSSSIDSPTPTSQATGMIEGSHWFGRVGLAGMIYHSGATCGSAKSGRHCAAEGRTLAGAFSGAMPVLIGYVGAKGKLDAQAWELYAILFLWQFPHFMAIAWMYRADYARADPPRI